jgi:hypothetical protein
MSTLASIRKSRADAARTAANVWGTAQAAAPVNAARVFVREGLSHVEQRMYTTGRRGRRRYGSLVTVVPAGQSPTEDIVFVQQVVGYGRTAIGTDKVMQAVADRIEAARPGGPEIPSCGLPGTIATIGVLYATVIAALTGLAGHPAVAAGAAGAAVACATPPVRASIRGRRADRMLAAVILQVVTIPELWRPR